MCSEHLFQQFYNWTKLHYKFSWYGANILPIFKSWSLDFGLVSIKDDALVQYCALPKLLIKKYIELALTQLAKFKYLDSNLDAWTSLLYYINCLAVPTSFKLKKSVKLKGSVLILFNKILYIIWVIGLVSRVFANDPGALSSIPGRVIPKTLKMVLDTSWLNTQQYKVHIEGKVEQSRERSSTLPYTSV